MGAKVTIVEMLDRLLPVEDSDVSDFMAKALKKQGMDIRLEAAVEKLDVTASEVLATIKSADGNSATESFSHVVIAGALAGAQGQP